MIVISFSEVSIYQTCEYRYYYQIGLGLMPIKPAKAIQTGVDGHQMLERFYKSIRDGKTQQEALDDMHRLDKDKMTGERLKAWMLAHNYASKLDLSKGHPVKVEDSFVVQPRESLRNLYIGLEGMRIGITPDLVLEDSNGDMVVEDYKFVGRKWPDNKLMHYRQVPIYMALLKDLGFPITKGYIRFFNTTTGKTSHKSYRISDSEIDILLSKFVRAAIKVRQFKELPVSEMREEADLTMNYFACQYCPFAYPCSLEAKGKSAAATLANEYTDNDYGYIWEE